MKQYINKVFKLCEKRADFLFKKLVRGLEEYTFKDVLKQIEKSKLTKNEKAYLFVKFGQILEEENRKARTKKKSVKG